MPVQGTSTFSKAHLRTDQLAQSVKAVPWKHEHRLHYPKSYLKGTWPPCAYNPRVTVKGQGCAETRRFSGVFRPSSRLNERSCLKNNEAESEKKRPLASSSDLLMHTMTLSSDLHTKMQTHLEICAYALVSANTHTHTATLGNLRKSANPLRSYTWMEAKEMIKALWKHIVFLMQQAQTHTLTRPRLHIGGKQRGEMNVCQAND